MPAIAHGLWVLLLTRKLARWVLFDNDDPPDPGNIWGNIYDHLYQKEKQQARHTARLTALLDLARQSTDAIKDAVVLLNPEGELGWWNQAAQNLLGLRRETDRGQHVTNLLRDPRFIRYFRSGDYETELEFPSPRNKAIQLLIQIVEFGDGYRLLVARDITRLHHLEQTRKDFVANVSHELRTPLTVVKGYLETLQDMTDPAQKGQLRALQQMQLQTQRMELLVADLLLLSKLETQDKRTPPKPVDVTAIIREIYQEAQALNSESRHTITLELQAQTTLMGHDSELRSAFSNLVFNAIKYTPAGGHIKLRWSVDANGAHFCVSDNGPGIEEHHLPRLTERFYRADASRNSQTGGTGLGLAIVKHVLLHHDATLEIRSSVGKGSDFTCHFPRQRLV